MPCYAPHLSRRGERGALFFRLRPHHLEGTAGTLRTWNSEWECTAQTAFFISMFFQVILATRPLQLSPSFLPWQYEYVHRFCVKDCPHARYCRTWERHEGYKVFTQTHFQPWTSAQDILRSQSMLFTLAWTQSEGCAFPTASTVFESYLPNSSVVHLIWAVCFISVRHQQKWLCQTGTGPVAFVILVLSDVPWGILRPLFQVTASAPGQCKTDLALVRFCAIF